MTVHLRRLAFVALVIVIGAGSLGVSRRRSLTPAQPTPTSIS